MAGSHVDAASAGSQEKVNSGLTSGLTCTAGSPHRVPGHIAKVSINSKKREKNVDLQEL